MGDILLGNEDQRNRYDSAHGGMMPQDSDEYLNVDTGQIGQNYSQSEYAPQGPSRPIGSGGGGKIGGSASGMAGLLMMSGVPYEKAMQQGAQMAQQQQEGNYQRAMQMQKMQEMQMQQAALGDLLGDTPQMSAPQNQAMAGMPTSSAKSLAEMNAMGAAPNSDAPNPTSASSGRIGNANQLTEEDKAQIKQLWALGDKKGALEVANKYKLMPKDAFDMENKLRDEFIAQSKPWHDVNSAYTRIRASAKDPTAAGDIALIYNYMKMLDPGSVVREGEFATAANAGGVPERIRAQWNKVQNGERLSSDIRNDFVDRADRLYTDQQKDQRTLEKRYSTIAKKSRVDPDNVIFKYEEDVADQAQNPLLQSNAANPQAKNIGDLSDDELMAIANGG